MNAKVIGTGAAGNKGAIALIENGVLPKSSVLLLNSTLKDVPAGYKDIAIQFSGSLGGCGKEPDLGKNITLESLQNGTVSLDSLLDPNDSMVIIVNSSEGGTGCGSSVIMARYFKEVLKVNVHTFVFTGFEEDGRGLQNTIGYFQDLNEGYTVQAISNKKFLSEANGNKLKAEALANQEFARRVKILLGQTIVDSENNIDETDLYKLNATPGFMTIEYGELDRIKNVESFNKIVASIIDNSKSLDFEPSAKRIGVILNISEKTRDNIDYQFSIIKEKLGVPFELYTHIQKEKEPECIAIIASGMKMPVDEVKAIYERYKEESNKVNKSKDDFFSIASGMKRNDDDNMFNIGSKHTAPSDADKKNFFGSFAQTLNIPKQDSNSKFNNTKKADKEEEPPIAKY